MTNLSLFSNSRLPIKIPPIEQYKKVFSYPLWNYTINTIKYLKEFWVGLKGAKLLIDSTHYYKTQLTEQEFKHNLYLAWYLYLDLLDKSDLWEKYIETFNKLKKDLSVVHPHGNNHITTDLKLKSRYSIIEKKIKRKEQKKSTKHLRHKQREDITDEEYNRRLMVLKFWMEHAERFNKEGLKGLVKK